MGPLSAPDSKRGRTQRAVLDLLLKHEADDEIPTDGRIVFYELEMRGLAMKPDPKDRRRHRRRSLGWPPGEQDIIDALADLREKGIVPWNWVEDGRRRLAVWPHAPSVRDYLLERLPEAAINPWHPGLPPLLVFESGTLAHVMERVALQYRCPITGTVGQAKGFLITMVAPWLVGNERKVLYLGDDDRSGHDIEANSRRVLEHETGRELDWRRLGEKELAAIDPIWRVDGRDGQGRWARELEGLTQAGVTRLLRRELDALLPEPLQRVLEREQKQRAQAERLLLGKVK